MSLETTVKEYLRIDGNDDDTLLRSLIGSAKEYLKGTGVPETDSEQYKLAVVLLVTNWFENRDQNITGKSSISLENGLQSIILQLKAASLP